MKRDSSTWRLIFTQEWFSWTNYLLFFGKNNYCNLNRNSAAMNLNLFGSFQKKNCDPLVRGYQWKFPGRSKVKLRKKSGKKFQGGGRSRTDLKSSSGSVNLKKKTLISLTRGLQFLSGKAFSFIYLDETWNGMLLFANNNKNL